MPFERFKLLRDGLIRFTQPGAFNDPFEMPAFKAAEVEAVRRAGLAGLTGQTQDIMQGLTAGHIPQAAFIPPIFYWLGQPAAPPPRSANPLPSEDAIERLRRIDETFGILSLSGAPDNLLLWAHYASEHRGLAVQIDVEDQAFAPSRDGQHFQLAGPVRYSPRRPLIPETDEILFEHFFAKSQEWAYEQEFRIVRKLSSSAAAIAGAPYPVHLFPLPPSAIRRVIFGARVPAESRDQLIADTIADARFATVQFAQAVIDPERFKLDIAEVSPAPRSSRIPCKQMRSAGRVDDEGIDDGLGNSRPRAGRADVSVATRIRRPSGSRPSSARL
jgi:hypothetical protein